MYVVKTRKRKRQGVRDESQVECLALPLIGLWKNLL